MRPIKELAIGLAAISAFAPEATAHPTQKREAINGWLGERFETVAKSDTVKKDHYVDSKGKGGFATDPTGIVDLLVPEVNGTLHLTPNAPDFKELNDNYPDGLSKLDKNKLYSSIVLKTGTEDPIDKDSIINEVELHYHRKIEEGINATIVERARDVFRPAINKITGEEFTLEETLRLMHNLEKCGTHKVPDGQGNGYPGKGWKEERNGIVIEVKETLDEEQQSDKKQPSDEEPETLIGDIYGDCAFTVYNSTEQNNLPQPPANNNPEDSSASTRHIPNRWAAAGAAAIVSLRFII